MEAAAATAIAPSSLSSVEPNKVLPHSLSVSRIYRTNLPSTQVLPTREQFSEGRDPVQEEELVPIELAGDLAQAEAEADGASVRAGCGETAGEPGPDQGLHLGLRELVAHLDGRVAGDGGEDMVFPVVAGVGARDGREGILESPADVAIRQGRDHRGDPDGAGAEGLGLEPVDGELLQVLSGDLGFGGGDLDSLGNKEALHRDRAVGVVEPIQDSPLVGDVLVHDPQRLFRLLDEY